MIPKLKLKSLLQFAIELYAQPGNNSNLSDWETQAKVMYADILFLNQKISLEMKP